MSQENVKLAEKLLDVYNERSFVENVDLIDPDIVWDMSRVNLPDAVSPSGPSAFLSFMQSWGEGFESEQVEAEEIIDAGDRVVIVIQHHARSSMSHIEFAQHFAMIWTFRDGRAVRLELYPTRAEALQAVGQSEQDAHADS
jgi:ketosteroid isomerase-like protein